MLEKRADGHHVVAFDPSDSDGTGRRGQRRSPRGREEPRVVRGRRLIREGEEDIDEVVRTSRKRAMRTDALSEGEADKIQIEVGAVKGLQAKRGVKRGVFWIVGLSLLLFWVPVLGPAVAGYVGGRKAGTPTRAFFAALFPIAGAFTALAALAASTNNVPALVRHFVEAGSAGVVGSMPFGAPALAYVLSNLSAVMAAGPDALFLLMAFALVGGAVSEMKIQERMIPPITARIPASRVVSPMSQTPARALAGGRSTEVDGLVAKLNDALVRAEKERRAFEKTGVPAGGSWGRPRGFFGRGARAAPTALAAEVDEPEMGGLDPAGRRVVSQMLASTPPGKGDRRAKALRVPEVDFDLPQTIAFAGPSHGAGAEGRNSAHNYRPSKYYHIYGGSVNPVARAKLEKRLRRTHTLHAMRRGARSFASMVEVDPEGHQLAHAHEAAEQPDRPRSLETGALTAEMHYDALEHLENASFAVLKHKAAPVHHAGAQDDLGGLIAHLGEGGEAVVEESAVRDVEFGAGPVFDRRGRQRARIADDDTAVPSVTVKPAKPKAAQPAAVRQAIASVMHETEHAPAADLKAKVARSADRSEMSPAQAAKVNRWLKRTLETTGAEEAEAKTKAPREHTKEPAPEEAAEEQPRAKVEVHAEAAPAEHKSAPHKPKAKPIAPAFEVTHGSTEVDAEADADDDEGPTPKKLRSAADILREIKAQKKADKDAEPGEETAGRAKAAKHEADEIERHAREGAIDSVVGEVALAAEEKPAEAAPKASSKRRSHGDDLEEVRTDAEKLGGDLELTLAPIREEPVEIREISEIHAEAAPSVHAAPAEVAGIPQVGEGAPGVEVTEIQTTASLPAHVEPERDVKPGEVVLAGPSTDIVGSDPAEGELSAHDHERIRKRLQEGWNRL